MNRTALLVTAIALAGATAAGCSRDAGAPPIQPAVITMPDCDKNDLRKNETPDCGFYHRAKFYRWSWVRAGLTAPPADWTEAVRDAEKKKVTG